MYFAMFELIGSSIHNLLSQLNQNSVLDNLVPAIHNNKQYFTYRS